MIPDDQLTPEQQKQKTDLSDLAEINILQLIYHQKAYEGEARDYEFSRISMRDHWRSGYEDTRSTLARKDWLEMAPDDDGIQTHDIHQEG